MATKSKGVPSLDEILEQPCQDEHLCEIARHITDWPALAPIMGITAPEMEEIKGKWPFSVGGQRVEFLRRWKEKHGRKGMYHELCKNFQKVEEAALAEKVIDILSGHESSSESFSDKAEKPRQHQATRAMPLDAIKLKWKTGPKAPGAIARESVISDGSNAYFRYGSTVYEFSTRGHRWSKLAQCPSNDASLVVVKGLLTAVGGHRSGGTTDELFSLTHAGRWTKHYPPMTTKRSDPAVVCSRKSLIVAGGFGYGTLVAVELMDTHTLQWYTVSSLPHYFSVASATICGDSLYLMGGYDNCHNDDGSLSVLTCSLTALLESRRSQPPRQSCVWKKAANAPAYFTSCTTLCERVIAVGGSHKVSRSDADPINNVYQYHPTKKSWTVISHMPTSRHLCLVAALPYNSLLVVGGADQRGHPLDVVEIGSVH